MDTDYKTLDIEGYNISEKTQLYLQLLAEVENYPILYDRKNPNFLNASIKSKVYNQIADELKISLMKCNHIFKYLRKKIKNPPIWLETELPNSRKRHEYELIREAAHFLIINSEDSNKNPATEKSFKALPIKRKINISLKTNQVKQVKILPKVTPIQTVQAQQLYTHGNYSNGELSSNQMFLQSLLPSLDTLSPLKQAKLKSKMFDLIAASIEENSNDTE
ncbi:unnamed protein product [Diamesa serratosioi]